ncbi:protein-disulfide reductase DsbD [Candidatus Marinarcus aquaticus]|uniref:Thiol:disulfide interchange protein n=1 Tax=Candidatus Marinarcus aquaticus TaxID=2044504 RepID=A0A4Q0XM89_9BACT|nr:protein-disulfide reductase DsbD [Candidatus Marinarcus aquaticus]RXJ53784.1 thiol:disulfide interchange protein [Candidatus Marinarcus aquaticus]
MRKILFLLVTVIYAWSFQNDFLEPDEAFKPTITQTKEAIVFDILLGKDIYLYHDKLKVKLTQPIQKEITVQAVIPQSVTYDGFDVVFNPVQINVPLSVIEQYANTNQFEIEFFYQGCSKAGLCYAPMSLKKVFGTSSDTVKNPKSASQNLNETDIITNTLKDENFIIVLLTFFGFGVLLSLTPCVFPMIPILSSIIVAEGNKNGMSAKKGFLLSLVYVLAMSLAYTIAGVLAGLFGSNLQVLLQNPYVLVVFALIFVALAFSMFGFYRIEPPKWLQTRIYKTTDGQKGHGVVGIAVMGFLSALIVGPCVAPPLAGALVYIGQTGDALLGAAALFVLSLGMGMPLLALGVGAGKYMPKPGKWMDTVSKLFGILMLAIAVWMLDRVFSEYVIYLWAALLIGTGYYLLQYRHFLARTLMTMILIYGVLTFIGAISGATNVLKPLEKLTLSTNALQQATTQELQWNYVKNIAQLEQAIANSNKPVMLDFWAQWCVACKEFEEITFKDERVIEKLKKFTLLKADVTANSVEDKQLQQRFKLFGPPALIFWNKNGQEINESKIIGYKNPEDFLTIINKSF